MKKSGFTLPLCGGKVNKVSRKSEIFYSFIRDLGGRLGPFFGGGGGIGFRWRSAAASSLRRNGIRTESCAFGISSACCANGAFACFCRASLKPGAFEPAHRRSQKEKRALE